MYFVEKLIFLSFDFIFHLLMIFQNGLSLFKRIHKTFHSSKYFL